MSLTAPTSRSPQGRIVRVAPAASILRAESGASMACATSRPAACSPDERSDIRGCDPAFRSPHAGCAREATARHSEVKFIDIMISIREICIMRRLSLAHLPPFADVVELGSFSAAARRLTLTQPAVSLHIKQLEARLGVRLIERIGR